MRLSHIKLSGFKSFVDPTVITTPGQLVGIVSIGDIVKNHIAEVEMEVTAMRGYFATG